MIKKIVLIVILPLLCAGCVYTSTGWGVIDEQGKSGVEFAGQDLGRKQLKVSGTRCRRRSFPFDDYSCRVCYLEGFFLDNLLLEIVYQGAVLLSTLPLHLALAEDGDPEPAEMVMDLGPGRWINPRLYVLRKLKDLRYDDSKCLWYDDRHVCDLDLPNGQIASFWLVCQNSDQLGSGTQELVIRVKDRNEIAKNALDVRYEMIDLLELTNRTMWFLVDDDGSAYFVHLHNYSKNTKFLGLFGQEDGCRCAVIAEKVQFSSGDIVPILELTSRGQVKSASPNCISRGFFKLSPGR